MMLVLCLAAAVGAGCCLADAEAALQLYRDGRYQEALRELQPGIQRDPGWKEGHLLAGLCFLRMEDFSMALRALDRAKSLQCLDVVLFLASAEARYRLGQYEAALADLDAVSSRLVEKEDVLTCHRLRGWLLFLQEKFSLAARELKEVVQDGKGLPRDYECLGMSLIRMGMVDDGLPYLRAAAASATATVARRFLAALQEDEAATALKEKRYDEAEKLYTLIGRQYPTYAGARFNLALAEIGLKKWEAADMLLEGLESHFQDSYRYWYYRGHVAERLKRLEAARCFYQRALSREDNAESRDSLNRVNTNLSLKKQ